MARTDTFTQTLSTLEEYLAAPVVEKRDLAGILAGFAICAEVAWKATQDAIAAAGYPERGPKPSMRAAFSAGLITEADADLWSDLLTDRNLVAHTYRPEFALELVERVRETYLPALKRLHEAMERSQS